MYVQFLLSIPGLLRLPWKFQQCFLSWLVKRVYLSGRNFCQSSLWCNYKSTYICIYTFTYIQFSYTSAFCIVILILCVFSRSEPTCYIAFSCLSLTAMLQLYLHILYAYNLILFLLCYRGVQFLNTCFDFHSCALTIVCKLPLLKCT